MTTTAVVLVDDDLDALGRVGAELSRRYGGHYEVITHHSADAAIAGLRQLKDAGQPVALVLADLWMRCMTGIEFLALAYEVHPTAKRVLLTDWGDATARALIVKASALGQIDCDVAKPVHSPDEAFHEVVTGLLAEWAQVHAPGREVVRVIGEQWSARCHEVRDLLDRYGVPFRFCSAHSPEGQATLAGLGPDSALPVLALTNGRVLIDPTNEEAADALGGSADLSDNVFDVVVVGAGPAGLASAVYAASEGLRTLVLEREAIGGQAGTTSRIRNYLGFPRGISGSDLAVRAFQQAWHFGASFHLLREPTSLEAGSPFHLLTLSDGQTVRARAVIVATGIAYRRLEVPSLDDFVGRGVFYGPAVSETTAMASSHVFVAGGGNSAGQAAVHLASYAAQVSILVRGDSLAAGMSDYLVRQIAATANIDVRYRTEAVGGSGKHHLESLVLRDAIRATDESVPAGGLFVLIGAQPHTGWLPPEVVRCARGYVITGPDLMEDDRLNVACKRWPPLYLETSVPGVFAAGDVRHRSIKRVATAAGEGAMVVALIHEHLARPAPQLTHV